MLAVQVANNILDKILALQIMIAWAGEGACEPKRLDWWRTDLIDEYGGGDLFARLLPKTCKWASLEAVRQAAIEVDRRKRQEMVQPDEVRTIFFWGYDVDEQLNERLAFHKSSGEEPNCALSDISVNIFETSNQPFSREEFEEVIRIPNQKVEVVIVPNGREIVGDMLQGLEESAKKLAAALLPVVESYPALSTRTYELLK
ncbi:MAG: BREX-6 system BrxE protein [Rivularia sp. (in: Bacteria)]|nr:BREX-6 system BrxE protein [Rivularia sp. MS3]